MPRLNRQNIDRKTNKPNPTHTEGITPDEILNRAHQTRRDDDVIRTEHRTLYDIDYAIKWFIDNEIQPQITADEQLVSIPSIFANGEKWDNVRRLGYLRDEKGMLQSPMIMIKRNSVTELDQQRTLDVNRGYSGNYFIHKTKYNQRNRYEDELFPIPNKKPVLSEKIYIIDVPKYVTIEYELMIWCDFTEQLNDVVDQIMPYGRFSWGNDGNKFPTSIGSISFETVNTVGEDRLVRATIPLTVQGTLLSAHEARRSTLTKMFSIKKLTFDIYVDVDIDLFNTTIVPEQILRVSQNSPGFNVTGATSARIDSNAMLYLITLSDRLATFSSTTTVTIAATAAINPVTQQTANKNEFNVYINGQYIDKIAYEWTPSDMATQTIVFNTELLGYNIEAQDTIIVNGRWAS